MTSTVYQLDKAIGDRWTQAEIDYLVREYGVEVEALAARPWRVVAMNRPAGDAKPIYLTWRANCTVAEVPYGMRWEDDNPACADRRFDGMAGNLIVDLLARMVELAKGRHGSVVAELNGVEVSVKDGDTVEERDAWRLAEQERQHKEYIATPEYKERCRLAEEKAKRDKEERAAAFATAPEHMALRDAARWAKIVEINSHDGYSSGVTRYSEKWARLMEAMMAKGATVAECAQRASHLADDEGITGFMYGCAVSILSEVWQHGEDLRRWHNIDTQIGTEGAKANESGGVLNPALLSIG